MTHRFVPLLALALLGACDQSRRPPARDDRPAPETTRSAPAQQSIMQPKVIAESGPQSDAADDTPAPLPSITISFAQGAGLQNEARAALDALLADPALPPGARFVLRGHSDSDGSDTANLITSRRRANAVRAYLIEKDIPSGQIEVIALGERRPVAPNANLDGSDNPEGRAQNRRVDVEVLQPETAPDPSSDASATSSVTGGAAALP